jgi:3'-5' exoribonuclease 1
MNYIIYDIECTCWDWRPANCLQEVIEIGAVLLDDYGDELEQFSSFVKPVINPVISHFCTNLTGIEQHHVAHAKSFGLVVEQFRDWIGEGYETYQLISWGPFDKRAMIDNLQYHGMDSAWVKEHVDLKEQYERLKKLKRTPALKEVVDVEGFDFDGKAHRALSDAYNTAKIFRKYLGSWPF